MGIDAQAEPLATITGTVCLAVRDAAARVLEQQDADDLAEMLGLTGEQIKTAVDARGRAVEVWAL